MKKRKSLSVGAPQLTPNSLVYESDKGCAIIVGTKLQELLLWLHETQIAINLRDVEPPTSLFRNLTGVYGPLSTFAGSIQLAYAYGLIREQEFRELELIRSIRNEAAHSVYEFSFSNPGVKDVVLRLTWRERLAEVRRQSAKVGRDASDLLRKFAPHELQPEPKEAAVKPAAAEFCKLTLERQHFIKAGIALEGLLHVKHCGLLKRRLLQQVAGLKKPDANQS